MEAIEMNERTVLRKQFELRPVEASLLRPAGSSAKTVAVNDRTVVPIVESTVPAASPAQPETTALFSPVETSEFRTRWDSVQAEFVDAPRSAVEDADRLVAEALKRLADFFAAERVALEAQNLSTEDLRLALRRYRSFFERIVASSR
jgi:hypothetical protein